MNKVGVMWLNEAENYILSFFRSMPPLHSASKIFFCKLLKLKINVNICFSYNMMS